MIVILRCPDMSLSDFNQMGKPGIEMVPDQSISDINAVFVFLKGIIQHTSLRLSVITGNSRTGSETAQRCQNQKGADCQCTGAADHCFLNLAEIENGKLSMHLPTAGKQIHDKPKSEKEKQCTRNTQSQSKRHLFDADPCNARNRSVIGISQTQDSGRKRQRIDCCGQLPFRPFRRVHQQRADFLPGDSAAQNQKRRQFNQ